MPNSELKRWTVEKVSSVLTQGLVPGEKLYNQGKLDLSCMHKGYLQAISGIVVMEPWGRWGNTQYDLQRNLYNDPNCLFPTLTERLGEPLWWGIRWNRPPMTKKEAKHFQTRMSSSMLIVQSNYQKVKWGGTERMEVLPKNFDCIAFPEAVWEMVGEDVMDIIPRKSEVIVVKDQVKRSFWCFGRTFEVPDYEAIILNRISEDNARVWVHGVRLPTHQDVWRRKNVPGYADPKMERTHFMNPAF